MRTASKYMVVLCIALCISLYAGAQGCGFNLIVVGDTQPQTEDQISRLEHDIVPKIGDIVDEYRNTSYPTAILLTGDVVWDTVEFLPRVKSMFEQLGVPVYAVIGNHDHNRKIEYNEPLAESDYEASFGAKNYTITLGDTHFFALDNIAYNTYDDYSIDVDRGQLRWLKRGIKQVTKGSRIAIMMHAPVVDYRTNEVMDYARKIIRLAKGYELHFITGHRHRHATADISATIVEHSVAQVNGNLWFAPICSDGTPQGVFCIEERDGEWFWHHRLLGENRDKQLIAYPLNSVKDHLDAVVVKVVGWDKKWSIEWLENGVNMGAMEQIKIMDPDYTKYVEQDADYDDIIMQRLRQSAYPQQHYFRCKPSSAESKITIVAHDRFRREYRVDVPYSTK